jgi:hypothetical protein
MPDCANSNNKHTPFTNKHKAMDGFLEAGVGGSRYRFIPQEFVVMLNHVHGIVWLFGVAVDDVSPGRPQVAPTRKAERAIRWGDRRSPTHGRRSPRSVGDRP